MLKNEYFELKNEYIQWKKLEKLSKKYINIITIEDYLP